MSDQTAEDPLEPELDPGLPHRRSEHGGMPPRTDDDYELAVERDRVAAGLADYVPRGGAAGDRSVRGGRQLSNQTASARHLTTCCPI